MDGHIHLRRDWIGGQKTWINDGMDGWMDEQIDGGESGEIEGQTDRE